MLDYVKKMSFKKKILSSYILFIGISCLFIVIYIFKSMETPRRKATAICISLGNR